MSDTKSIVADSKEDRLAFNLENSGITHFKFIVGFGFPDISVFIGGWMKFPSNGLNAFLIHSNSELVISIITSPCINSITWLLAS